MKENQVFEDLFVLEVANNHLGKLERGKKIIEEFAKVICFNNIKAAIKLKFRGVDWFIHKDFRDRQDIRYIKTTMDMRMSFEDCVELVQAVKDVGCITISTPFDDNW